MFNSKESIVKGFTEQDPYFLEMTYKDIYPSIRSFVKQNSGDKHDAEDVFQDSMVIVLKKVNNNRFDLNCTFKTFMFSVCKRVWLNRLRGRGFIVNGLQDEDVFSDAEFFKIDQESKYIEEHKLFKKHFYKIDKLCQKVLRFVIKGNKTKEIVEEMAFPNENSMRQKLLQCKLKLLKRIKSDKKFQELKNEY
ncbi:MAG: sigma-70 family RNA polymerase sigma factor [Bacteroidales bacterium]|nr:sigma-70 family RNA polymerase sigma factor [Bacteroidales bacterium]